MNVVTSTMSKKQLWHVSCVCYKCQGSAIFALLTQLALFVMWDDTSAGVPADGRDRDEDAAGTVPSWQRDDLWQWHWRRRVSRQDRKRLSSVSAAKNLASSKVWTPEHGALCRALLAEGAEGAQQESDTNQQWTEPLWWQWPAPGSGHCSWHLLLNHPWGLLLCSVFLSVCPLAVGCLLHLDYSKFSYPVSISSYLELAIKSWAKQLGTAMHGMVRLRSSQVRALTEPYQHLLFFAQKNVWWSFFA